MCTYHSRNNFTVKVIDENKTIKAENEDDITHTYYQDQYIIKNQKVDYRVDIIPKDVLAGCYLGFHIYNDICQDDNYQERLLPPDIFKVTKSDEPSLLSISKSSDTEQSSISCPIKRKFIEHGPLSIALSPKIIDLKQRIGNENEIKKNISLNSYTRSSLWHTKTDSIIVYRYAIKKINIDSNKSFENYVLEKMARAIKKRGVDLLKYSIDLSPTYSNVRKYTLEKLSLLLNEDLLDVDILITPGMSVSDLRNSCISNKIFLKKTREYCKKITENILSTPDNFLSCIFQRHIAFNQKNSLDSTNTKIRFSPRKDKFLPKLKELIVDTISNLPRSIIYEIENLDQSNIVNALFSDVHGALISKSSIKNLNSFFNLNKNKFVNIKFDNNLNSLNDLLDKIGNLVRTSCIFHEVVFLPGESTVEQLSKYLLSDIYGISSKFHKKIKLSAQNILKHQESSDFIYLKSNHTKSIAINTTDREELQIPKEYLISSRLINIKMKKIETNDNYEHVIKEFNLNSYRRINLFSMDIRSNIYEDAIKKIDIDNDYQFKNRALDELGTYIISRGFTKLPLNLSQTYSNVSKYILDKISPHINDIMITTDVLITPGISLLDIRYKYISNIVFFDKLHKKCEEIVKNIHPIPNNYFLSIIQSIINFGSTERLVITHKKNKLCQEVKLLIIETISNLPNKIIHELKKLKQSEIVNGLFANIHGVYLSKSLIRNIQLLFNSNKLPNNDHIDNLELINNLLTKLFCQVKRSTILHEGKIFFPGESTAKLLSKYLLLDMYYIPFKLRTKLKHQKHINDSILESNYKKNSVTNIRNKIESSLSKNTILVPQKKSKWNYDLIPSLNIYELAISMINIDKGNFEDYFIDKVNHYSLIKEYISKKEKINIDLSTTYSRIKNHISKIFKPFLKEIDKETKEKVRPTPGMTVGELRLAYILNEKFFDKFRKFCNEVINSIRSSYDNTLTDMIQYHVCLEKETDKAIRIDKKTRIALRKDITNLLIRNISNAPEIILGTIKLIPNSKFVDEWFSNLHDIYVDNASLLKAKSVFNTVQEKVIKDPLLSESVDKVSLNIINKIKKTKNINTIINNHIICKKTSIHNYIRKLVREDLPSLKGELRNTIMIMRNDKIEIADQKIRDEIFDKLGSNMIKTTIKSYKKLCLERCKAHKSKMENKKL